MSSTESIRVCVRLLVGAALCLVLAFPVLMALGIGVCAVTARAVMEAILGFRSPFVRTPKFGGRADCDLDPVVSRRRLRLPTGLIETFTPSYFQRVANFGRANETPVFIVGMPRSGTTLTEQILASHPKGYGAGERNFASRTFARLPQLVQLEGQSPIDCVDTVSSKKVTALADWHLAQLARLVEKSGQSVGEIDRVFDKMPENYSLLGWIATMFPTASIIHCRRDPRDVAVSCWLTHFKEIRWAFDVDHIAHRIQQYQRLMEHWRRVLPVPILEIDYEETVADFPGQTARLLQHVGLPWHDACLSFYQTERLVRTASVTQVRQPVYRRSIERWRHYEQPLRAMFGRIEA